jgi:hypothetical protein
LEIDNIKRMMTFEIITLNTQLSLKYVNTFEMMFLF